MQRAGLLGIGGGQLLGGGVMQSQTAGGSWSAAQYAIAFVGAHFGAKIFGKFFSPTEFQRGARDLIFTKLVWTELIGRSQWAKQQFGGFRYNRNTGTTWLTGGGRAVSMQGLVQASPLDGLVQASPLDGTGYGSYGGLLPSTTSPDQAMRARWSGDGYTSEYNAAYS